MSEALARAVTGGVRIAVRLTPRGGADAIDGVDASLGHLRARVRAAPEKGAANTALEALLAKAFGVAPSAVRVTAGATGRRKIVELAGLSLTTAQAVLARFGDPHDRPDP